MLDKIERLKTEKLLKWARATCPDNHEWIIDHIELLRGHVAEVCLSATKQKLKLKAKTAWSVDPKELTFETYTARLGIEGEMRMMLTYLFKPTAQGAVYFVNLLDEVREVLFKSQSEDRVESKYENKTDVAAYLSQLKRDFESEVRHLAQVAIYPQIKIFVPKRGGKTYYVVKTADGKEVHEKHMGDMNEPLMFRWFRSYVWSESNFEKFNEYCDHFAEKYAMFPESKTPQDVFRYAVRLMDSEVESKHQLDDSTMAIITDDPKKWAWGVVSVEDGDATKPTPAWGEWEAKFTEPKMIHWWRVWLGLIFDPTVATGLVNGFTRSQANLALVWVKSAGKEGSTVVRDVIARRLGENVVASIRGEFDQFEMASYFGKRLATVDDCSMTRILYRGNVHSIITGADQSIETKGNQAYTAWVNCSVYCTSNHRIVANRFAADQMRRLLYIVLRRTNVKKTPNWSEQLHAQWGDYMAKCRIAYEKEKAISGTQDIFNHYADPAIAEHYAAMLSPSPLIAVHEVIRELWKREDGARLNVNALQKLYRESLQGIRGGQFDESEYTSVALRDTGENFEIRGQWIYGLRLDATKETIINAIVGEGEHDEA